MIQEEEKNNKGKNNVKEEFLRRESIDSTGLIDVLTKI